ncbi:MAG: hemolysin family protein [Candidatus Obscuribacterales bacterium]|nr:hemolysin family protein [Candidatus Obscuribacterales bacterium]
MTSSFVEIAIILLLLVVNGILAMSELAIVSARKERLHQRAEDGDDGARVALAIAKDPADFLATVQIGITLVGIIAGAYGGATIADHLSDRLVQIELLAPYADAISMTLVVATITYLSLIVGELLPKRLALHSPEKVASIMARPMMFFSKIAKPGAYLLSGSCDLILKLLRLEKSTEPSISESEIHILVEQAAQEGVVERSEQEMVASVFRLGELKVEALMTPRTDIVWIDITEPLELIIKTVQESTHAWLPVAEGSLDKVVGIAESRAIISKRLDETVFELEALIEQPLYVPESTTGLQLLQSFLEKRRHLALVIDEYGGLQGLVTRHDLFQSIVGDLSLYDESPRWQILPREDGSSWLCDGQVPVDEFQEFFSLKELAEDESDADFQTLAGFVLYHLKHLPMEGEHFIWQGLRFEVVDMDRNRIDKVMVSKIAEEAQAAG